MKIFDYQNKDGKFIFISKDFPGSTVEKKVKLPKCIVIGYEIKHTQEGKELLIKESRSGDILVCDVTDLSKNVLQKLIEDIQKSIRMNSFYLQKHFIPIS
ncbi:MULTISPECIES: hypothetical protein [Chryseobacterium]|uniref:SepF-like predicted cell division protein (DUF552 family) n=1 Tax=Chryseobacterium geocarposphaerae TaxID=1416776 RepID=A0ABU1LHB3_9FLAO|nr:MULTISPECIES: hypothetical protein [Chryseobacterium]MDR6406104.1 SepF-like predicted cell division protein (DUF552 family) [Chryseobacterium geocarposphaerae]MDR6699422.1 SepF-like predicted cell division protein (DUF552 family) [Chryseobacterium ginsenosidimutans]